MKTAEVREQSIEYVAECPYCKESTYSDIHFEAWKRLEYADGTPYGVINCPSCENEFELE